MKLIDSFQTKHGTTVSVHLRGRDVVLTLATPTRTLVFPLGRGDASRLATAVGTAYLHRPNLTILKAEEP